MVRDDCVALRAELVMTTGGFGFGWLLTPEPAEFRLAAIRAGLDFLIPIRTLPSGPKAMRCVMV